MDLSGEWRAAAGDDRLRLAFHEPGFADDDWGSAPVPGHWRRAPHLAGSDGPVLYRTRFSTPERPESATRSWLVSHGSFYMTDLWLDGHYLGLTEGYFCPHEFEIGELLAARSDHVLAVEVGHRPTRDQVGKRALVGVFDDPLEVDPTYNPGGLWRPVVIEHTGPVRLRALRARCVEATSEQAVMSVTALLDADEARTVTIHSTLAGSDHLQDHPLGAGDNRVEWTVGVDEPELWWPWALGDHPLHDLDVRIDVDEVTSDERSLRVGLRTVAMRRWALHVNGERLFVKGATVGPTKPALAEVSRVDVARDVSLALDAGLDLLRVRGHVAHPLLYDEADRRGLLLWQDMPLHQGYARGVRKEAVRQAEAMVDLLAHHPSIAVWCGHNSPAPEGAPDEHGKRARFGGARAAIGQQLPTWNKTVLDRSVKRAIDNADGSRPVIAHSGVWPHPPQLDGTDTHLWFGWRWGNERDLPRLAARMPRAVRFVSEFGAGSVPEAAGFCEPHHWPDLDWDRLAADHAAEMAAFDTYCPPRGHVTFEGWRRASQAYQAGLLRRHIETLRRLKYRPTGGFTFHRLADASPGLGPSILDHERRPKAAYDAVREACRPVIVVADRLPAAMHPGEALTLDVHLVSDRRAAEPDAVVTAELSWPGGSDRWRWTGEVPADDCVRIGTISWVAPEAPGGPVTLRLGLEGPVAASNRYDSQLVVD